MTDDPFLTWFQALETRHLANLRFAEVRRALQALSAVYVERRDRLAGGAALDGAGKRAAFALFYGPLHFLLIRALVRALSAAEPPLAEILDLGCGTGAAGAAWALEARCPLHGVDRNGWAVEEARWTLKSLRLQGQARTGELERAPLPGPGGAVLAAFAVNELEPNARGRLLRRLLDGASRGLRILIVEPIARRSLPWWDEWTETLLAAGGRTDEWRFPAELPERLRLLDKAAGLRHSELKCRSIYLAGAVRAANT